MTERNKDIMKKSQLDRAAFGRRLNSARREQQISSEQLSVLCDLNAVFIRKIESSANLPSLNTFVLLCNKLRISPNFLLSDSLIWNEEDKISDLSNRLRALSPHQLEIVIGTVNVLIDKLTNLDELS